MTLGGRDRNLAPTLVKARPGTWACGDLPTACLHPHIVSSELQPPGQRIHKNIRGVIQTPSNHTTTSRAQFESKHSGKEEGPIETTEGKSAHAHTSEANAESSWWFRNHRAAPTTESHCWQVLVYCIIVISGLAPILVNWLPTEGGSWLTPTQFNTKELRIH